MHTYRHTYTHNTNLPTYIQVCLHTNIYLHDTYNYIFLFHILIITNINTYIYKYKNVPASIHNHTHIQT